MAMENAEIEISTGSASDLLITVDLSKEEVNYGKNRMNLVDKINKWLIKYRLIVLLFSAVTPVAVDAFPSLGSPLSF